ncbi:MAG: MATE family efflux transporter [Lachnospiraceae bacterium]|nr:MATE family efflux transporter [Lachnospiraceae bacterium]
MEEKQRKNLTEGGILRVLTGLALPIMASSFLATAYNITDMAWIGRLGSQAVAGIGAGGMYVWLSQGLSALARMGGQVNMGQCIGRGEEEKAVHYAEAAMKLVFLFGILFGAVCVIFTAPLIAFFGMQDAGAVACGQVYLKISCGLILFSFLNHTLTGLFTAQGNSVTPFRANLIGLVLNMLLDPILIFGLGPLPRLEAAGAAVATVAAQAAVTTVLVLELRGTKKQRQNRNLLREMHLLRKTEAVYYREVLRIGIPTAIQSSLYCMISMVLTRMVAGFGSGAVATQRVGGQIESISWNMAEGFASAMNAFVAQNYGAGKMDRVKKGYRLSFVTVSLWGMIVTVIFLVFAGPLSGLFFHEAEVLPISEGYFRIVGLCEAFMCVELMSIGAISGLGNTKSCSVISVVLTGLRIPLALLLGNTALGVKGIWWALTVTSIMKGIVLYLFFWKQCRKYEGKERLA